MADTIDHAVVPRKLKADKSKDGQDHTGFILVPQLGPVKDARTFAQQIQVALEAAAAIEAGQPVTIKVNGQPFTATPQRTYTNKKAFVAGDSAYAVDFAALRKGVNAALRQQAGNRLSVHLTKTFGTKSAKAADVQETDDPDSYA